MPDRSQTLFSCEREFITCDRQRVVAVGEIDVATLQQLSDVLREAQTYARHVVLDLGQTTFIDAGGARILLAARAHARATAATFSITGSTAPVQRLLGLLGAEVMTPPATFPPSEWERVTLRAPRSPHRRAIGRPRSFAAQSHDDTTSARSG